MKIKRSSTVSDKIEMNMTPMIDVVFQLLTFFLFSLRTVDTEGNFSIKMPSPSSQQVPDNISLPKALELRANTDGSLASIKFEDKSWTIKSPRPKRPLGNTTPEYRAALEQHRAEVKAAFEQVQQRVIALVGQPGAPAKTDLEVELDCSKNLNYEYVITGISAVSGKVRPDGEIDKLIEKIRFKPQR
ncbi:MAG: biopolymer transporter ExbD [Pirellulales bacterium]|nr:biopolymer transporter ExbD [Pirellulales bacterium]